MKQLYLTSCSGQNLIKKSRLYPSYFLQEIPRHLLISFQSPKADGKPKKPRRIEKLILRQTRMPNKYQQQPKKIKWKKILALVIFSIAIAPLAYLVITQIFQNLLKSL